MTCQLMIQIINSHFLQLFKNPPLSGEVEVRRKDCVCLCVCVCVRALTHEHMCAAVSNSFMTRGL